MKENNRNNTTNNNKGILAFINKKTNEYNYSPFNMKYVQKKQKNEHRMYLKRRKNKHNTNNNNNNGIEDLIILPNISLKSNETEFTLLFFGASYCRHTMHFATILSNFVHITNTTNNNNNSTDDNNTNDIIQCIYIPMDDDLKDTINYSGLGFFSLLSSSLLNNNDKATNRQTRNILCALCTISIIPIVVVINNKTGNIITDNGRYVIEQIATRLHQYDDSIISGSGDITNDVIEKWRCGYSGASFFSNLCNIS